MTSKIFLTGSDEVNTDGDEEEVDVCSEKPINLSVPNVHSNDTEQGIF